MTFELPLKDERVKPHQITALHLIVGLALTGISAFLLVIFYMIEGILSAGKASIGNSGSTFYGQWYIGLTVFFLGLVVLYIALFRNRWLTQPSINKKVRIVELVLVICVALYALLLELNIAATIYGVLALVLLFAIFWENNSAISNTIEIADDSVKLPANSKRRKIQWREIDNVIYKYNTLTINTVDGRMYQWTIKKTDIDQEALKTFCFANIKAAEKDRVSDDW